MPKLRLQKDVFVCEANGHLVFLDLVRDAYSALDRNQSRLIKSAFLDFEEHAQYDLHQTNADMREVNELMRAMISAGLLTAQCEQGRVFAPPTIPVPRRSFSIKPTEQSIGLDPIDVLRFFAACLRASWALRSRTLIEIVESIRARMRPAVESAAPLDIDATERLVLIFHHLRPFYPRPYLCLYDSLAILEFLATYGIYPRWVYGVTTEPFYAHCWVQKGDVTFNEAAEVARSYTPIMVV